MIFYTKRSIINNECIIDEQREVKIGSIPFIYIKTDFSNSTHFNKWGLYILPSIIDKVKIWEIVIDIYNKNIFNNPWFNQYNTGKSLSVDDVNNIRRIRSGIIGDLRDKKLLELGII